MRRPLCAACLLLILGMAVYNALHPPSFFSYEEVAGSRVVLTGTVCEKTKNSAGNSFIVAPEALSYAAVETRADQNIPFQDNIICYLTEDADLPIGSLVMLEGTLSQWDPPGNPGQFDAALYYKIQGISAKLYRARILAAEPVPDNLQEFLWQLRNRLCARLDACFAVADAAHPVQVPAILKTMLLGERSDLSDQTKTLYREAGILHILAISGLHISLIGMGLYKLLRRLHIPVIPACILCGAFMIFYGMLVGMPVSTVRAIAMFLLRLLADCLRRTYDMQTALSVCAVGILIQQPLYLYHSGFLLSFTAVLAITLLKPALLPDTGKLTGWRRRLLAGRLTDAFFTSFSVSVLTLPVQLFYFYEVPMYGVFLNLFVIPSVSVVMLGGMGALFLGGGGFGGLDLLRTYLINFPVSQILSAYETGAAFIRRLPGSMWTPGKPKTWQVVMFCMIMLLLLWGKRHKLRWRYCMGLVCGAVLLFGIKEQGWLTVTFLDVGQGDCICVELPNGSVWLFDGGSTSVSDVSEYRLLPFLKSRGISEIEAVFLSHEDADHINGVEELLRDETFKVELLVLPAAADSSTPGAPASAGQNENGGESVSTSVRQSENAVEGDSEAFQTVRNLAAARDIPVLWLAQGMSWKNGDVSAMCMHPAETFAGEDTNAASMVIYLTYGEFSMLLTGDVEGAGERQLTAYLDERAVHNLTVLKVSHHGSRGTTSDALLQQLQPEIAVISCGKGNRYGHPHQETLERLAAVGTAIYRTDEKGAIIVEVSEDKIKVVGYKK
mgnify:FL=1